MNKTITLVMTSNGYHDRRMMRIRASLINAGYRVQVIARVIDQLQVDEQDDSFTLIKTSALSGPAMYYSFNQAAFKAVLKNPPDLIYAVDLDTLWAVYRAHKALNIPFVFDAHEFYSETPELNKRRVKKWIWSRLGKIAIPRSAARWTVTETIASALENKYGVPFQVVRNVPPLKSTDSKERPQLNGQLRLVYLGVLNEGRGLVECIRAMKNRSAVYMDILGRGDIEDQLKRLIKELNLQERCRLHGWVEQERHQHYFDRAHYGINLLDASSESYRLSLANKFFDYVHAGLPAIHMNYPEYTRLNDQHEVAVLMDELKVDSLEIVLDLLAQDVRGYERRAQHCLHARAEWCWEREQDTLLEQIKKVLLV